MDNQEEYKFDKDKINIVIKDKRLSDVKKYYLGFGWDLVKEEEDKKYNNLIHLTFNRSHKLPQKDKLILMQIRLENKLNDIDKYEFRKNNNYIITGAILYFFNILLVFSTFFLFIKTNTIKIIIASLLIFISAVMAISNIFIIKKIKLKSEEKYNKSIELLKKEINDIYVKSKKILGE